MVATTGPKRPYPPEEGPSIPLTMVESRSPSTPSTKAPKRIPQKESQERAPSAFGKLKECASVFNQLVIVSCVFWPIYGTILLLEGFSGLGRAWGYGWAGKINGLVRFMDSILHWTHMVIFQVAQILDHFADLTMIVDTTPYRNNPATFPLYKNLKENLRKFRKNCTSLSIKREFYYDNPWPRSALHAFSVERWLLVYEHESRHSRMSLEGKEEASFLVRLVTKAISISWTLMFTIRLAAWRAGSILEYRDQRTGELLAVAGMTRLRSSIFIGPYFCRDAVSRACIYHDMMKCALEIAIEDEGCNGLIVGYSNGGMRRVKIKFFKAEIKPYPWSELRGFCKAVPRVVLSSPLGGPRGRATSSKNGKTFSRPPSSRSQGKKTRRRSSQDSKTSTSSNSIAIEETKLNSFQGPALDLRDSVETEPLTS